MSAQQSIASAAPESKMQWKTYIDLDPIKRLKYEGRELLGKEVFITVKRDGENISAWLDDNKNVRISSHRLVDAASDIVSRFKKTPEYNKVVDLLTTELERYDTRLILYGELLLTVSPTRIEPKRKNIHWVLFDIYDCDSNRYIGYDRVYQYGYDYKIPVVELLEATSPSRLDELIATANKHLDWCKRHRREGIVGKCYSEQVFFKEKINLPKRPKIDKPQRADINYPPMPEEKIIRALQHAYDELGSDDLWKDKAKAMPLVAKHISTEAREHYYAAPQNLYGIYINTPIEQIRVVKSNTANATS